MMSAVPLVSIGVPTCDRASMLERALKSLAAQDYPELEILVSDNASEDETPQVCARLRAQYPFISYHRVTARTPATENFQRVLQLSKGQYFMWAADDDLREPTCVSTLVKYLEADADLMLVASETQYMLHSGTKLPFFPEGVAWYDERSESRLRRLLRVVFHNYGDLIYGLYRREALISSTGSTALDSVKFINEIPIYLQAATRGKIRVCDQVLLYKTTCLSTYLQAAREFDFRPDWGEQVFATKDNTSRPATAGSILPAGSRMAKVPKALRPVMRRASRAFGYLRACYYGGAYHLKTMIDISRTIRIVDITWMDKLVLLAAFAGSLAAHLFKLEVLWPIEDLITADGRQSR
jgi:glycosyltransferase domain-containing protein